MLAEQRQRAILRRARRDGVVLVADLMREHRISYGTARRDLDALASRRLISRIHGGALPQGGSQPVPAGATVPARPDAPRPDAHGAALARRAATLIRPGTSVAISTGINAARLSRELRSIEGLTVITNCLTMASESAALDGPEQDIIVLGGAVGADGRQNGPLTIAALAGVRVDTMILDAHGMDPVAGFTAISLDQAETDRAMIDCARQLVVLAGHERWAVAGLATIAPLSSADILLTDTDLPAIAREVLAEQVDELIVITP